MSANITPLELARLCQASYTGGPGFIDVDDLRFGIFDRGDLAVVVFRGSANGPNWLRNLEALPALTKSGHYAHHGFVLAMNALADQVGAAIPAGKPVIFTGHSLGGAIAVLFAQICQEQAVTFGCPRVWWSREDPPVINHVRVICDDDPVPMIPAVMFRHDCTDAVFTLEDHDILPINPEEHCIGNYIDRLTKGYV